MRSLKLLGIIAMVLVIGFSMAACNDGNNGSSGIYTGPEWPAAFMANSDPFKEDYFWSGSSHLVFFKQYDGYIDVDGWAPPSLTIGIGRYNLVSIIPNGKIVVADYTYKTELILCTSYEVGSGSLTFTCGETGVNGTYTRN